MDQSRVVYDEVDLWFDPLCSRTWITYRWLREVERVRPVRVRPHCAGVAVMRADALPGGAPEGPDPARGPARVLAAAGVERGRCTLAPLYEAMARRLHTEGGGLAGWCERWDGTDPGPTVDDPIRAALMEVGLCPSLAREMAVSTWDDVLRAEHRRIPGAGEGPGAAAVTDVPVLSVNGHVGRYGPVLSAIPADERAGRVWDGFRAIASEELIVEVRQVTWGGEPAPDAGP
ncbi:disulfide bond formation protein DsbA [Streptomyces sp. JJ38]|uniref:mycothiol-dependent nitroreductase Rv2466c family protein n=1 Tax=Streptomyces sp. JJ38 TaxID=2738128 RepID=UPI001C588071|nr:disulfide bond formation protein DsbA [Streptomyces sp. JJ38]MBW1595761.1 disulfide bond formation protein DsbA [Streptomyces sp. JJ38]